MSWYPNDGRGGLSKAEWDYSFGSSHFDFDRGDVVTLLPGQQAIKPADRVPYYGTAPKGTPEYEAEKAEHDLNAPYR